MSLARAKRWILLGLIGAGIAWTLAAQTPLVNRPIMRVVPSEQYREWWKAAQVCVGRERPMESTEFYIVEGTEFQLHAMDGVLDGVIGFYDLLHDRIYLSQAYMFERATVEHEMVHALGVVGHPKEFFEQCGL